MARFIASGSRASSTGTAFDLSPVMVHHAPHAFKKDLNRDSAQRFWRVETDLELSKKSGTGVPPVNERQNLPKDSGGTPEPL
jgi:hypothetical protein